MRTVRRLSRRFARSRRGPQLRLGTSRVRSAGGALRRRTGGCGSSREELIAGRLLEGATQPFTERRVVAVGASASHLGESAVSGGLRGSHDRCVAGVELFGERGRRQQGCGRSDFEQPLGDAPLGRCELLGAFGDAVRVGLVGLSSIGYHLCHIGSVHYRGDGGVRCTACCCLSPVLGVRGGDGGGTIIARGRRHAAGDRPVGALPPP